MQKTNTEADIVSTSFAILTQVNAWLLIRHQWIIKAMQCLVKGQALPTATHLATPNNIFTLASGMPESLQINLRAELIPLTHAWVELIESAQAIADLASSHQFDELQRMTTHFMRLAEVTTLRLGQHLTTRDALTGARTRLTLHDSLNHELKRAERHGHHCCIALLDQNAFKKIYAVHGDATGDKVLIETVHMIQMNLRSIDTLFRYGGDEWLILMPATTLKMAVQILQRLCKQVDMHTFVSVNDENLQSTLSYGVAESVFHESVDAWITRAENAIVQMKNTRGD